MDGASTPPPPLATEVPQGEDALHGERMVINMGPSHPSTHGVLRLVLTLDGEVVKAVQPHLGYLHRGMEKIAESMTYHQFIPYTDRLDYLAPLSNNVAYVLAIEKLMGITVPPRARVIRVMCCEIARISAHLLWLGTGALDLGAATIFFHTFRERETLYNIIESLTGGRLTTSYTRVGGVSRDLPDGWTDNAEVQIKVTDKHHVWVKQSGGMELQLLVVKRMPAATQSAAPKPAPVKN